MKIFQEVKVPVIVKGMETVAPAKNGEPEITPVVIVCFLDANTKNLLDPIKLETETPYVPSVPARDEYVPVNEVLPAITSRGVIAD